MVELQEAKFLGNSNREAGGGDFPVQVRLHVLGPSSSAAVECRP